MSNRKKPIIDEGKFPKLWTFLIHLHKTSPEVFEHGEEYLKTIVAQRWTALNDPTKCANCNTSMKGMVHRLDFFNALLLKRMGEIVRDKVKKGVPFSEANTVHVVSAEISDALRHRTTQCRTLGLIAKVKNEDGRHDREKGWLITKRGWAALRGERVPQEVVVFKNRIEERPESMTTIDAVFAFASSEQAMEIGERRNPEDWVEFIRYNFDGELL